MTEIRVALPLRQKVQYNKKHDPSNILLVPRTGGNGM